MNAWDNLSEAARQLVCEYSWLDLAENYVQLQAERDQLAAGVPLVCSDERHQAKVAGLESALAALHEGEEPYEDERVAPNPGQWIWNWNRSTPAERLSMAAHRLDLLERFHRCVNGMHEWRIAEYDEHRQVERARAERYRSAWRSARRRAAQAEAKLAELQADDEPCSDPFAQAYARLFALCSPNEQGAAFGDAVKHPWDVAAEQTQQRELVKQLLAEHLAANPVPGINGVPYRGDVNRVSPVALAAQVHRARMQAEADYVWTSLLFGPAIAPVHEPRIWEDDEGEWNVSCTTCHESARDMGSEHDCEVWAEGHAAERKTTA
ncbi:hypothetical protein BX265_6158 [Streptomyces sp. TLI_235]|nr:hypothetical protein [Streptomyces sp. TLI_235]PBC71548.1 hypothetical protein BX265_6158 [Streptomyces sp. TLI_235]